MAKFYVHVGMPKCGSSLLQDVLLASEDLFREKLHYGVWAQDHPSKLFKITCPELAEACMQIAGNLDYRVVGPTVVEWLRIIKDRPLEMNTLGFYMCYAHFLGRNKRDDLLDKIKADVDRSILESNVRSVTISSEFLCNPKYSLEPLVRFLEGHEVVVVAAIRRQDKWLKSAHNMCVRAHSLELGFRDWLNSDSYNRIFGGLGDLIQWSETIERFANQFGPENVKLEFFEDLKQSNTAFVSRFLNAMDVPAAIDDNFAFRRVNPSLSPVGMELLRRGNKVLPPKSRERADYWQALEKIFADKPHQNDWVQKPPDDSEIDLQPYARGNRSLIEKYASHRPDMGNLLAYYTGESHAVVTN